MDSLNIYSLNVNGLGDSVKRSAMWNNLRKYCTTSYTIFLQETQSRIDICKKMAGWMERNNHF